MRILLIFTIGLILGHCFGYAGGAASHQNVNDLIDAGFSVVDPEGFPIARFE
jgi:hypothetical protein